MNFEINLALIATVKNISDYFENYHKYSYTLSSKLLSFSITVSSCFIFFKISDFDIENLFIHIAIAHSGSMVVQNRFSC